MANPLITVLGIGVLFLLMSDSLIEMIFPSPDPHNIAGSVDECSTDVDCDDNSRCYDNGDVTVYQTQPNDCVGGSCVLGSYSNTNCTISISLCTATCDDDGDCPGEEWCDTDPGFCYCIMD